MKTMPDADAPDRDSRSRLSPPFAIVRIWFRMT